MEELFREDLLRDERILWTGQPEPSVIFTSGDILLVPFSLLWCSFAIFWEAGALGMTLKTKSGQGAPPFFPIFGSFFVLMGLYFVFGRFIYKAWRKRRTYYAVTNKRVMVLAMTRGRNLEAEYIDAMPAITKSVRRDGVGSIAFGNRSWAASLNANTGMGFFGGHESEGGPAFYDIKDAAGVYQMVSELRNAGQQSPPG